MITQYDVVQEVRKIAAERPDFIYRKPQYKSNGVLVDSASCMYINSPEGEEPIPGCIFGHALLNLGVEPDRIRKYEGAIASSIVRNLLREATVDVLNADWMNKVQDAQDDGVAWGDAVASADEAAERRAQGEPV
jgi:hypothetical protein